MKTPQALLCFFVLFKIIATTVYAQDTTARHSFRGDLSANFYGANTPMPFWLRANQYGVVPQKNAISISGQIDYEAILSSKTDKWRFVGSAQVVGNVLEDSKNEVFIPQLYAGIRYGSLLFYVGRKKEQMGLADTSLTSGSYIWSGNALPLPKIQIELSDYVPIGKNNPWLGLKGNYAHGWFGTGEFANGYFLHQKSLYLRLGRKRSAMKFYGGFNHQVQWGGKTTVDLGTVTERTLPSSFVEYLLAVIAIGPNIGIRKGTNAFDSTNRVGNHLGTIDVGFELDLKKYNLLLYRQSIYEDGSLFYLTSIADGLNGIVLTNLFPNRTKGKLSLKKVLVEILNTRSQGGEEFIIGNNQKRGNDNYFNHQQYYDGWSYRKRIIGTPFLTNRLDTNRPEPQNSNEAVNNNRVLVYHLGFEGYFGPQIHFLSKLSYSANYGTYIYPYPTVPKQLSGLFQLSGQIGRWNGLEWSAAFAIDKGELYQDSIGGRIGIRKVWSHKK